MTAPVAIVGGGVAGLTVAWQLHRLGVPFVLLEGSGRVGGIVRTVYRDGFVVELGPDGWVSEKSALAELALELGLGDQLIPSNDATRVTWVARHGHLEAIPNGMRMMVPTDLEAMSRSTFFSDAAKAAYASEPDRAAELITTAPGDDESIAAFVVRHFGDEVLESIAAPLLSGVFGGDIRQLSVQAVMPQFVALERSYGSLIAALQQRMADRVSKPPAVFTSLAGGMQLLVDALVASLPDGTVHMEHRVPSIVADADGWVMDGRVASRHVVLATPANVTRDLLEGCRLSEAAALLPARASSAILIAFAFEERIELPAGFGFLVPSTEQRPLLACTFVDQKFSGRVPAGRRLIRAFLGGTDAWRLAGLGDEELATIALDELTRILGPLPCPLFSEVQRWPSSLPQYEVGHLARTAKLKSCLPAGLHLAGNAYCGVGLPDIVRDACRLGREIAALL